MPAAANTMPGHAISGMFSCPTALAINAAMAGIRKNSADTLDASPLRSMENSNHIEMIELATISHANDITKSCVQLTTMVSNNQAKGRVAEKPTVY